MSKRCPICSQPVDPKQAPFCSRRCADIDLSRWFTGAYAVPGEDEADADVEQRPDPGETD